MGNRVISQVAQNEDGFTRSTRIWHENYDGDVVLETRTDVTQALKDAESANNEHRGRKSRWREGLTGNRIATIPTVVYMELHKKGIVQDQDRFKKWLNDSDNSAFRTRPGKI